jgi:RNA polymerase sigma factor (TIGR02999 family)
MIESEIPKPGEITRLVQRVQGGDRDAFDRLLPLVYPALKEISRRQLRRGGRSCTLCTTELVHEAYLKLAPHSAIDWQGRAHFFAVAARAMRQVLMSHARRRDAAKRGGGEAPVTLTDGLVGLHVRMDELVALDEALGRLADLNGRLERVVELRFFGGMTEEEIAEVLGVTTRTVERDWLKARLYLHRELYPGTKLT